MYKISLTEQSSLYQAKIWEAAFLYCAASLKMAVFFILDYKHSKIHNIFNWFHYYLAWTIITINCFITLDKSNLPLHQNYTYLKYNLSLKRLTDLWYKLLPILTQRNWLPYAKKYAPNCVKLDWSEGLFKGSIVSYFWLLPKGILWKGKNMF